MFPKAESGFLLVTVIVFFSYIVPTAVNDMVHIYTEEINPAEFLMNVLP